MAEAPHKQRRSKDRHSAGKKKACPLRDVISRGRAKKHMFQSVNCCGESSEPFHNATDVGLIYDVSMLAHRCPWDRQVPESPQRIRSAYERCQHYQLVDRCKLIEARPATKEEILTVHDEDYFDLMKKSSLMNKDELMKLSSRYDGVFFNNETFHCALLAAGSAIELVEQVTKGQVKSGMALVRPPGHHALKDAAVGYCYFNNVAIAVRHALSTLNRILIVDWDIHHGQSTQYEFYDDPRVLVCSIHRYENGTFWPELAESNYNHIGSNAGIGYNVNVPLNQTGVGNADYVSIFYQVILPIALEFAPELVIVSCGFDSAIGDPEGENDVSPACYPHLIHMLKSLAGGRLCLVLEGGYCEISSAESAALSLMELLDDPCPTVGPLPPPSESIQKTILQVIGVLRVYWNSLCFQHDMTDADEAGPGSFFHIEHTPDRQQTDPKEPYDIWNYYPTQTEDVCAEFSKTIQQLIDTTYLHRAPHRTCLVYDEKMRLHKCTSNPGHPERPDRISAAYRKLEEYHLVERCLSVKSRIATEDEINLVHKLAHINQLRELQYKNLSELHEMERDYNSLYLSQDAYECAALAVGSTLAIVDSVLQAESETGVAIVRPPGHHAESHIGRGFCFFNNVAIATRYAQKQYNVNRVLIIDWDVHHGNGTQHFFENDPSVLFISLHRYNDGTFFPGGPDAGMEAVGVGKGTGYNINIPWNSPGWELGDAEYISAFTQVVMPVAYQFCPDLVLVSAGYDAGRGDPLGCCQVTPEGFACLTHMLLSLANRKLILVLEGGYNLITVSESLAFCTAVLLSDTVPRLPDLQPSQSAVDVIRDVVNIQQKYWNSLCYQVKMPSRASTKLWLGHVEEEEDSQSDNKTMDESLIEDLMQKISVSDVDSVLGSNSQPNGDVTLGKEDIDTINNVIASESDMMNSELTELVYNEADSMESNESRNSDAPQECGGINEQVAGVDLRDIGKDEASHVAAMQTTSGSIDTTAETMCRRSIDGTASTTNVQSSYNSDKELTSDDLLNMASGGDDLLNMASGGDDLLNMASGGDEEVEVFAVIPLPWCPHLSRVNPLPPGGIDAHKACEVCEHTGENWVCLICYQVLCGRYINGHMLAHGTEAEHVMVLSLADLSVWCYACQQYIHHETLLAVKRAAHLSKFGEDLPGIPTT